MILCKVKCHFQPLLGFPLALSPLISLLNPQILKNTTLAMTPIGLLFPLVLFFILLLVFRKYQIIASI